MNKIFLYCFLLFLVAGMISCSEDEPGDTSIFPTTETERSEFDKWILENYVYPYNIDFKYRMEDFESDMDYNLVPADLNKSVKLAHIVKHLWLEAYDEITGDPHFMRQYAPKILHLIGSPAIDAISNTIVLGTAEGGLKVTLYNVNELDPNNIDMLNEYYFKTMHHEFAHILHQTKNYPTEFNTICVGDYALTSWVNREDEDAWKLGFVTAYGSSEPQEDFVEVIANYLVKPTSWWDNMLSKAGATGRSKIEQKLTIARNWLETAWNIDIDELRKIIERRSEEMNSL